MHFFTEPDKLIPQTSAQSFGPVVNDPTNKYNVGTSFQVNQVAKLFACQDSLMIIQPYVDLATGTTNPSLVNVVLKPIKGLEIPFDNIKYYIYRGVEAKSFVTASNPTVIIPQSTAGKTEFIDKFWKNWDTYVTNTSYSGAAPSSKSFGYNATLPDTTLLEEIFNSQASHNTEINELQAIKISEGEWIGNLLVTQEFTFEIITDTDHLDLNLGYVRKSKQVIDTTGLPNSLPTEKFLIKAAKEKILNYVDPAAFFGMYYQRGLRLSKTSKVKKDSLYTIVLDKFLNKNAVYLDIRSERGYYYNYYENYGEKLLSGGTVVANNMLSVKSKDATSWNYVDTLGLFWPIILLDGGYINPSKVLNLRLRVDDNQAPILFSQNPRLFGNTNVNNFISTTDLIDNTSPNEWTKQVDLHVPLITGTHGVNVAHHIKLQYFRTQDNTTSPDTILKAAKYLDAAFGNIRMPALDIPNPFQHLSNSKTALVNGGGFAYIATNGIYQDNNLVLFYVDNAFSLKKSNDVFPKIDISKQALNPIVESPLLRKDIVYNKWQINEGGTTIGILEMVGYNKTKNQTTSTEDLFFLGLTKTELATLNNLNDISNLHHKYFLFEEIPSQKDSITGTAYKKYKLKVQGLNDEGKVTTKVPATDIFVYGSHINMLCSKAFASATNIPVLLPDPGIFTEFENIYRLDYDSNDTMVTTVFPSGVTTIKDDGSNNIPGGITSPYNVGLIGEVFYPVDSKGETKISNKGPFPLAMIIHGNGQRYSDYRQLGTHLAKNGFIVGSISSLAYAGATPFPLKDLFTLPNITPTFTIPGEYYLTLAGGLSDALYVYSDKSGTQIDPDHFKHKHLTIIHIQRLTSTSYKIISKDLLSWKEGEDFEIERVAGKPNKIKFKTRIGRQGVGILGRANILFAHLRILEKKFPGKVSNSIGLIGHSRGGEAVIRAAQNINIPSLNKQYSYLHGKLDKIDAIISLAPTDQATDKIANLTQSIPYLVLYGSYDADVTGTVLSRSPNRNSGYSLYDRTINNSEKSFAFVHGATHNGFITDNHDYINKGFSFYNSKLENPSVQKKISLAYMNAFFRVHLKNENIWKGISQGNYVPLSIQKEDIYIQYKNARIDNFKVLEDFESGTNLGTSTGKVSLNSTITNLKEGALLTLDNQSPHDTRGLLIEKWNPRDVLTFHISATGIDITQYQYISFRIGHVANVIPTLTPQQTITAYDLTTRRLNPSTIPYTNFIEGVYKSLKEMKIKITDINGQKHEQVVGRELPNPHFRENQVNWNLSTLDRKGTSDISDDKITYVHQNLTKSAMITVRIPLATFNVDLTKIKEISLVFPPTGSGKIIMDDMEFTN